MACNLKKSSSIIFAFSISLLIFSGCKNKDTEKSQSISEQQIQEEPQEEFVSPMQNTVSLIHRNRGYYFDESNCELIYLDCEGSTVSDAYLITEGYNINFDEGKISKVGWSQRTGFLNSGINFSLIETENDRITKIPMKKMYNYIPAGRDETEVLEFCYKKLFENFLKFTGEYEDKEFGTRFELRANENKLFVTVRERNGREFSEELKIIDKYTIKGDAYQIYYSEYNDTLSLYRFDENLVIVDEEGYIEPNPHVTIARISLAPDYMSKTGEPVTLHGWEFVAGDKNRTAYYVGDESLSIGNEKIKYYSIYKELDGYCYIVFENHKIRLIDGDFISWAFDLNNLSDGFIEEDYLYICNNGTIISNINATSTLKEGETIYSPENILYVFSNFANSTTNLWLKNNLPWVEGVPGTGIGEGIEFDIEPTNDFRMVAINLTILSGYVDPLKPYLFRENSRIKKLQIITDSGYNEEIEFEDTAMFTTVQIPVTTTHVRMVINDVYPGTKYEDTCISAIAASYQLWDK